MKPHDALAGRNLCRAVCAQGNTAPLSAPSAQYTMRVVQGGIIGSGLIALGLSLFGIFLWLLRYERT